MIINHKLKNIINAICLLIILFSCLISILHYYHLVNISKILHSLFHSNNYLNNVLSFLSIKTMLLYLWILNVGVLFLLWLCNRYNEEQVLLKELSLLLQNQEMPEKLVSYMVSDTLGNVYWSAKFFTQIFKIKSFSKKENFINILKSNDDIEITEDIVHSIAYNLKMKQSSYIDLSLKIGTQDSALRLSYTRLNFYYVWQVMLVKQDYSIYNPSFSVDIVNHIGLPVAVANARGLIIYKNDLFIDTFKIHPLKDYFISDIMPTYVKNASNQDRVLGDAYICKDVQDNDLPFVVFETPFHKVQNNALQYSRFVFIPQDTYSNGIAPLPSNNVNDSVNNNPSYGLYLEDIYNYAPFGIMVVDNNSNVVNSNLYIQQNFVIKNQQETQKIYDILGEQNLHLESFLSSNESSLEIEIEVDKQQEEQKNLFKLVVFPLIDNHRIIYLIDITQNRQLQEQIKLSQGLQTIGQIASVVAHDFNNLLTAIMSFTYFLQERHNDDDPSRVELDQIKQNANRAKIMIKQLLTFSRKQELNPVVFEVNSEISDLMTTILRLMGEKITSQFNRGKNVGKILMDKVQFQQVITNLVVNARDAMKNGGKLEMFTSNILLKNSIEGVLGTIVPGSYVLIEVKDYGCGVSEKNLKLIFQSHFSTKGDKGNGLGLSTVQKIITDNAGFIDIKSKLNEGTSIYLYLPKTDQEIPAVVVDNEIELDDLTGSETILLVEDELPVAMVCSRLLKSKGYNVIEANSGDKALSLIKEKQIKNLDLVISDVMMPGLSGPELIARLRDTFVDIKAILISGYTEDILDDINGDISLKGIDFLAKPFSPDVFASKVKSVLTNNKNNQKRI